MDRNPRDHLTVRENRAKVFSAYFGIVTALLLPASIAGSTWWLNRVNSQQTCIKENAALTDKIIREENVDARRTEAWRTSMAAHADLLAENCAAVGIAIPAAIRAHLVSLWNEAVAPATARSLASAITKTEEAISRSSDIAKTLKLAAQVTDGTRPPPRIYIHATPDRRLGAEKLQEKLRQERLRDQPIIVPAVIQVSGGPGQSELRCFRKAECEEAKALLHSVSKWLVSPGLQLHDLSERYETSTAIRPRHYELWFASEPIQVAQ